MPFHNAPASRAALRDPDPPPFPDHLAHQVRDAFFRAFHFRLIQQYFRWLGHRSFPFAWTAARSSFSPAYSNALLLVSSTRTRSSLAFGKCFNLSKISMQTISVVGTLPRNCRISSFIDF